MSGGGSVGHARRRKGYWYGEPKAVDAGLSQGSGDLAGAVQDKNAGLGVGLSAQAAVDRDAQIKVDGNDGVVASESDKRRVLPGDLGWSRTDGETRHFCSGVQSLSDLSQGRRDEFADFHGLGETVTRIVREIEAGLLAAGQGGLMVDAEIRIGGVLLKLCLAFESSPMQPLIDRGMKVVS